MTDTRIKEFLEDNIFCVDANDWVTLFNSIPDDFIEHDLSIGDVLLSANINFLKDLTEVPENAFAHSQQVTSLSFIPANITAIGACAFYGCSNITDLAIPNTITTISTSAFENCNGLKTVRIPGSVKCIEETAFTRCSHLQTIIIENGVETIESWAFAECDSLTTLKLPKSIKHIDQDAFAYCGKALTIQYDGTVTEWETLLSHEQIFTDTQFKCKCSDSTYNKTTQHPVIDEERIRDMNLFEKLNRLDDGKSLRESTRVISESLVGRQAKPTNRNGRVLWHAPTLTVLRVAGVDENNTPIYYVREEDSGREYLTGLSSLWMIDAATNPVTPKDLEDDQRDNKIDEMLTESTNKVKIEVKYETYGRYGDGGDIKTGRVSGSTEVEALMKMLDHVHMYTDSDYAEEFKEENGRYPTTEEVVDKLYDQNGDGCDLIYWIRNLTTGEMIFDGAVEDSEPEEWDD